MTPQAYLEHALAVAQRLDVHIVFSSIAPHHAAADVSVRIVYAHPIIDETTYAVVMHELGHLRPPDLISLRRLLIDGRETRWSEECAAWQWAEANALEWTEPMTHTRRMALTSYLL